MSKSTADHQHAEHRHATQHAGDVALEHDTHSFAGEHVYDGITEYDNPTPGWWKLLFGASCIFAVFYWLYFHLDAPAGRTIYDDFDRQAATIFQRRFHGIGDLQPDEATLLKYLNDPQWLKVGEITYKANCVSCHGLNGEGLVGPNLTDDNWKNVTKLEDIAKVIEVGAANGSMPAWRNRLSHVNLIVLTSAYVASLRGTNPANPKAPEGNPIPPWPAGTPASSGSQ